MKEKKLYGDRIGYLQRRDPFAAIDIDTELDFMVAEAVFRQWGNNREKY
jgi:hypothetical protein